MSRWIGWIVIGGLVVVGVVVGWPVISRHLAVSRKRSRCAELEQQLILIRTQGGDVAQAAQIEQLLIQCASDLAAMGEDVDPLSVSLTRCTAAAEQINQEWAHYRSTSYDDPVKRNNTRTAILRIGEEMARCYRDSIDAATTAEQLVSLRGPLNKALADATARYNCYRRDSPGCGRFGVNEDHGNDKAAAERERVIEPLRAALAALDEKLRRLDAQAAAKATEGERRVTAASPGHEGEAPTGVEAATATVVGSRS